MRSVGRNLRSAKTAGSRFERLIADHLNDRLCGLNADRQVRTGARDAGDIAGVHLAGKRVAIECKNVTRMDLPKWTREAHTEADNIGAAVGVVVHKRHGNGKPEDQWVTMTVADLTTIINLFNERNANGS
nr:MAG TPA: HOLLIDAY JUNCTION RESOLVASE HOMOLOGOUS RECOMBINATION [Caudoviricetes sp.]